jgi:multiple sugar transport system substrate-binding protein
VKPSFRWYDAWSSAVGDGLIPVWTGEKKIDDVLPEIKIAADEVLSQNQ